MTFSVQLDYETLPAPDPALYTLNDDKHPPRILILCGSLRNPSYSRFAASEAERALRHLGPPLTLLRMRTLRSLNCVNLRFGRKGWFGLAPSGTAP